MALPLGTGTVWWRATPRAALEGEPSKPRWHTMLLPLAFTSEGHEEAPGSVQAYNTNGAALQPRRVKLSVK